MSIASRVITAFTKTHQALAPKPPLTAAQVQAWFDQSPEECRLAINGLVADLVAQTAAGQLGFAPTADIASSTVQTAVEEVLVTAKDAQRGTILPGTLTVTELVVALARAAVASRVHDVGGTATAITATDVDITALYDNMPFNCIIGASNSAAATTLAISALGAKPVYKVGTTTAPNLTAGKQASFWYDAGAACFFLKASAEGTATVAQVLAGVPFSTEVDSGLVGTMPDRAGDTAATDVQYSGTTIRLRASEGSRDGANDYITHADGARVTGNIRDTATIDGVAGTYDHEAANPITAGDVVTPHVGFVNGAKITGTKDLTNLTAGNLKDTVVAGGITGTYDHEATNPITAGDVVAPHVGFVNGAQITGTVVEKVGSATVITPSTADQAIPAGRYGGAAGDGKVLAVANAIAAKIKLGEVIAGVTGTLPDGTGLHAAAGGSASAISSASSMSINTGLGSGLTHFTIVSTNRTTTLGFDLATMRAVGCSLSSYSGGIIVISFAPGDTFDARWTAYA